MNHLIEAADCFIRLGMRTDDTIIKKNSLDISDVLLKHHKEHQKTNTIYRFLEESG